MLLRLEQGIYPIRTQAGDKPVVRSLMGCIATNQERSLKLCSVSIADGQNISRQRSCKLPSSDLIGVKEDGVACKGAIIVTAQLKFHFGFWPSPLPVNIILSQPFADIVGLMSRVKCLPKTLVLWNPFTLITNRFTLGSPTVWETRKS